ncbi:coiled-coil domain-containing protein 83 [Chanos chanos]|uniref:Coiled-coil domain-containing protein 83 n=1 Tax=Chanos chanos TaxID=29144 RepID=A0A6J2WV04_CHACN|nr:coiled-coil domain-containing protein 83 [Chanos chanos]
MRSAPMCALLRIVETRQRQQAYRQSWFSSCKGIGKKMKDECKTSLAEAVINFQIQVKRKEIDESKGEISQLEVINQRLLELREQLKEEQMVHVTELCKQVKEQERKLEQREVVNKEQVEHALQEKLEVAQGQEKQLSELRDELKNLEEQLLALQAERQIWLDYKNVGSQGHQRQIEHLETELSTLQTVFQETSEYIRKSHKEALNEIDENTTKIIDEKIRLAKETALKHQGKYRRQEELEINDFLKKKVAFYQKEVAVIEVAVQQLEAENLEHLEKLYDHGLADLPISRKVLLTRVTGLGQNDSSCLERTMQKISLTESSEPVNISPPPLHPVAEAQQAKMQAWKLEGDERVSSCGLSAPGPSADPPEDQSASPYGRQTNLQEPLHLGALEKKLLSVVGHAVPLHITSSETDGPGNTLHTSQDGALTTQIIRSRFQ